jgi:hypothetical protein
LKKCEFAIVLKDQTQTFTKFDAILSCWIFSLRVALIPYLTAGDPDLDTTAEAMRVLDSCGCDIIKLGVTTEPAKKIFAGVWEICVHTKITCKTSGGKGHPR